MNIVKNDKVVVLSGKDKGKTGEVLSVDVKGRKVVVQGVSVATKHQKARKQTEQSSIIKVETPIYACKVMVVCPKCGKPTRIAHKPVKKVVSGKEKTMNVRVCKHCGADL
jgi:large subunit ribosomal protein L24